MKFLPHRVILPWWLVASLLGGTALVTVAQTAQTTPSHEDGLDTTPVKIQESQSRETEKMTTDNEGTFQAERSLIEELRVRLQALKEREQRLLEREQRLEGLKRDLEKLAAVQKKEAERLAKAAEELEAKKRMLAQEDPSLKHLRKVYAAMDPEEAAMRIEAMKEPLALEILAGLKEKNAASVLAGVDPNKAARLSEGLRQYRKRKLAEN